MDDAFWYGTTMSLKGRHTRQIAAWQDAYEEAEDALREWRSAALSAEERAERLLNLNNEMMAFIKKMGKRIDFLEDIGRKAADMDEVLKKLWPSYHGMKASKRLEEIKARVEEGQKEQYRTIFRLLLDYVPGLREDLEGDGIGILRDGLLAYEAVLRQNGITPEMLTELKATGYSFAPPSGSFGKPTASPAPEQDREGKLPGTFASKETIQLREEVAGLKKSNSQLVDDRFEWAYQATLNKAEAEGHKAVLDLVRNSPRDAEIDVPSAEVPAPAGHLDSLSTAAFRRAYVTHLLEAGATRGDLMEFAADTAYEFQFPVADYMDWIAAQSLDGAPSEGQQGPRGPR